MSEKRQDDRDRLDRDQERTTEAHWRVAEAGADETPTQKTPNGSENPVPKREDGTDALKKLDEPAKKS